MNIPGDIVQNVNHFYNQQRLNKNHKSLITFIDCHQPAISSFYKNTDNAFTLYYLLCSHLEVLLEEVA